MKCAKVKDCELVVEWMKSIINHLYWSAMSTPDGNEDEIKEKWMSVNNHIHNKHSGHGKIFKKCAHPRLRGHRKHKKWFKPRKYNRFGYHTCSYYGPLTLQIPSK